MGKVMRSLVGVALLALISSISAGSSPVVEMTKGKVFYETNVVPKLVENGCPMCHAVGYVQPNVMVYEQLLPYLAMGDSPTKTAVIRKIANLRAIRPDLPTHPGGQRCETIDSDPCKTIIKWWEIEFGDVQHSGGR